MKAVHDRGGRRTEGNADDNKGGNVQLEVLVLASEGLDRESLEMFVRGISFGLLYRVSLLRFGETYDKDKRDGAHDSGVDNVACEIGSMSPNVIS